MENRKVKFRKWLSAVKDIEGRQVASGKWEEGFAHEGLFHQWGNAYEEFETGPGNYTIALIETHEGIIEPVLPNNIQFLTPTQK